MTIRSTLVFILLTFCTVLYSQDPVASCTTPDSIEVDFEEFAVGHLNEKLDDPGQMNGNGNLSEEIEKLIRANYKLEDYNGRLKNLSFILIVSEKDELVEFFNAGHMIFLKMGSGTPISELSGDELQGAIMMGAMDIKENEEMKAMFESQKWTAGVCENQPRRTVMIAQVTLE